MLKLLRSTCADATVAAAPREGRLPRLRVVVDGEDYATIHAASLAPRLRRDGVAEFEIPLPRGRATPIRSVAVSDADTGEVAAGSGLRPVPAARKKRGLVIYPAGEIHEHDRVRWYRAPFERVLGDYFNTGDMVVFDSTLKLLDYADVEPMKIMNPTEADIERYASEFDFIFIRGSNFIHEKMQWFRACEVLERVPLPVYAIGVGAQASEKRDIQLTGDGERLWRIVGERCAAIGVRGAFTAETLARNGIDNVEIVGCPSMFRTRNRDLKMRVPDPQDIRRVGFSLRREADRSYTADPARYLALQRQALLAVAAQSDVTVTCHGEIEEKAFALHDPAGIAAATEALSASGWWAGEGGDDLARIYRDRLFFFLDVARYDVMASTFDLAVGYRVHGILPAIAQGVPAVMVAYDTRSQELAETLGVPLVGETTLAEGGWRAAYDPKRQAKFAAGYAALYDRMRAFLDRNGVPHRM